VVTCSLTDGRHHCKNGLAIPVAMGLGEDSIKITRLNLLYLSAVLGNTFDCPLLSNLVLREENLHLKKKEEK
jgi:hypothetical protein